MANFILARSRFFISVSRRVFLGGVLICLLAAVGQAQGTAFSSEKEAIKEAVDNFLQGVGIEVTDLQSVDNGDGKKITGKVSLFGMDNLELQGTMQSKVKVKNISIAFPDGASIDLEKLTKMVGDANLTEFLLSGFPSDVGVSIKNLALAFADNGYTLNNFGANFAVSSYSIPGYPRPEKISFSTWPVVVLLLAGRSYCGMAPIMLTSYLSLLPQVMAITPFLQRVIQSFL